MIPKNKIKLKREQETSLMKIVREKLQTKNVERAIIPNFNYNFHVFVDGMKIDLIEDEDNQKFCREFSIFLEKYDKTPEEIKEFEEMGCMCDRQVHGIYNNPISLERSKEHFEKLFIDPVFSLLYYKGDYYIRNDLLEKYLKEIKEDN